MINFKKGTAHTLQQSDRLGNAKAGENIVSGMICKIDAAGDVIKGVTAQGVGNLLGFAIHNQTDGDVIESGKIGLVMLDGNSVVETDQAAAAITAANYPVGALLGASGTTGLVRAWESGDRIIGQVEGIRVLPTSQVITQNYTNAAGATKTNVSSQPVTIPLLGIKLAA